MFCFIEFPTSSAELDAVANIFDKDANGFIDYKQFMSALRTDVEKTVSYTRILSTSYKKLSQQLLICTPLSVLDIYLYQ